MSFRSILSLLSNNIIKYYKIAAITTPNPTKVGQGPLIALDNYPIPNPGILINYLQ